MTSSILCPLMVQDGEKQPETCPRWSPDPARADVQAQGLCSEVAGTWLHIESEAQRFLVLF